MAKMVPKIVKRAGTLNRHLRVHVFAVIIMVLSDLYSKSDPY